MASEADNDAPACPVDHKARAAWLQQSNPSRQDEGSSAQVTVAESCDSSKMAQQPSSALASPSLTSLGLNPTREVSTIPRANEELWPDKSRIANSEQETGADKSSGNWIYPSEQMFFNAMRRKNYDPKAEDMRSIVPIHNAVNERAWKEIKGWEMGRGAEA